MNTATSQIRTVRIDNQMELRATPERVFAALTTEQASWYPYNYGGDRVQAIRVEERVGGHMFEDWGDGAGVLYGVITYWDPPRVFAYRGQLRGAVVLEQTFTFEPASDGCVMKQSLTCFGEISDDDARGIESHGDLRHVEDKLRAFVERG